MTCEIAIMNLHAVALAADSALTVRQWANGEEQTRYFKGSNKIFQISDHQPVGMMIFDSANLQGVPWELIAKEFRASLGDRHFPHVSSYAEELFSFIRSHATFFSPERRESLLLENVEKVAMVLLMRAERHFRLKDEPEDLPKKQLELDNFFKAQDKGISKQDLGPVFPAEADTKTAQDLQAAIQEKVASAIKYYKDSKRIHASYVIDPGTLASLAVRYLYRQYSAIMEGTGVVFAGYGAEDHFPQLIEYRCYGLLRDVFVRDEEYSANASIEQPTHIKPFATTAMVETFLLGFNNDVWVSVASEYEKSISDLLTQVKVKLGIEGIPDESELIKASAKAFREAWSDSVVRAHFSPLRDVVASLPIDEIADLAETLVMLESLKEKVTAPTQSVGGPIDVAVISRNEGFIWIKRKHYFDPQKNPRYFLRQQRRLSS